MLEVRNNDWTDESLEHLKAYYKHQIDRIWNMVDKDIYKFMQKALYINADPDDNLGGYNNIAFPTARSQAACTLPTMLCVRLGDLSIAPCHRLSYSQFLYGRFIVEGGKILGIEANNTAMMIKGVFSNSLNTHHGCDVCAYKNMCMRACFGEQYEETRDPFMPDPVVCKLFKTKLNYLIDIYEEMNILEYIRELDVTNPMFLHTRHILENIAIIETYRDTECTNA